MDLNKVHHRLLTTKVVDCLILNNVSTVSAFIAHQPAILNAKCELLTLEDIFTLRQFFIQNFGPCQVNLDPQNVKNLINDIINELKSDYIYEIFGSPGCGKTQISLYLTAQLAINDRKVFYIDTKNDFSLMRLKSFFGKNPEEKLKNIKLAKVFDLHHVLLITDELASVEESRDKIDLIIIDNVASLVLPLLEDEAIGDTFGQVGHLVKNLKKIALKQNCAVLVINNASNLGSKPALGKLFDKAADKRFAIRSKQRLTLQQNQIPTEDHECFSSLVVEIGEFSICKE